MLMPSFVEIGRKVPEMNIFEGIKVTIYGYGGHLVHVPGIMYTLVPATYGCFILNLFLIGRAVSEKIFENGE